MQRKHTRSIDVMTLKRRGITLTCTIVALSASLLAGCAGFPDTINYSVYDDGFPVSSETVRYGSNGPEIVSESGVSPEVASGFKEAQDLKEFGFGREYGLDEDLGELP